MKDFPHWQIKEDKLHFKNEFKDFKQAFAFMTEVAKFADEINHHPEWFNCYNRVRIELVTHDVGGISDKDFTLAEKINQIFIELL